MKRNAHILATGGIIKRRFDPPLLNLDDARRPSDGGANCGSIVSVGRTQKEAPKLMLILFIVANFPALFVAFSSHHRPIHSFRAYGLHSVNRNAPSLAEATSSLRIKRVKDASFYKDILKDVTAAEFALRLEIKGNESKIGYDMLIAKLDEHVDSINRRSRDDEKENIILTRLQSTREELSRLKDGHDVESIVQMERPSQDNMQRSNKNQVAEIRESVGLILREDGTVDWDKAIESSKEIEKFGVELWERLNGKEEGTPSLADLFSPVQAKVLETPEISRLAAIVERSKNSLNENVLARDNLRSSLREQRRKGDAIRTEDLTTLRRMEILVKELEKRLRLFTLDLEMERVCVYIEQEIESSPEPYDQRVLIAEASLIDKQLSSLLAGLSIAPEQSWSEALVDKEDSTLADFVSLIDDAELSLIFGEVMDLQSRLGLGAGAQVRSKMDWGSLGKFLRENYAKLREGLAFYGTGTGLLAADLQYAWQLLLKAAVQGYTLKPREVNSLRRMGKDLLTLIPFVIILILPLSPPGHVLAFSFVQRFYPDFYPSFYTEKRLNLKRLFAEVESKSLEDIIGEDEESPLLFSPLSKLIADMMAGVSSVGKTIRNAFQGPTEEDQPQEKKGGL